MLVVDVHALRAVDLLDLVDQVLLRGPRAEDAQHLLRVDGALDQLGADLDVVAVAHQQPGPLGDRVGELFRAVIRGEHDAADPFGLVDRDPTRELRDRALALGGACLEQLLDARQTLGDVIGRGHTTGVEGTHRELRAGLTDRLGRDDADGLADVDELAGRERPAIALGARTDPRLARQHRAHLELGDAGCEQRVDEHVADVVAGLPEDLAVDLDRRGERPGVDARLDLVVAPQRTAGPGDADGEHQATLGAAVLLADDDVL